MGQVQPFVNVLILTLVGVVPLWVGLDVQGQEIPRDEYLRYLSLKSPEIVRQTKANAELHLFGNAKDIENYQDTNPVDGIDDRRHEVLVELAVEFAPYLVLNSTMIPMDFRLFMAREEAFLLSVDRWDVSKYPPQLVGVETIDWHLLPPPPSEAGSRASRANSEDRRLRSLLKEFDPFCPGEAYRSGAISPEGAEHQVMFFNFPGNSEETWKQEYENQISEALPRAYERFAKVFVHPFVKSVRANDTENRAYEFVLQYWFFYPYNDGFNNHEGDWEHINVFIKPLDKLHEPLSKADVHEILTEGVPSENAEDRLVIQKVDYYFHHNVMTLDYTRPNVYQSQEEWEREFNNTKEERFEEKWIWEQLRYRAYCDDKGKKINTHPIGFIGGDNVGIDQVMRRPGSSNRVSNGTYPFSGRYKNVGQGGAAEWLSESFDHRKYFATGKHKRTVLGKGYQEGSVVGFASPARIEIIPDGERVRKLVKENAQARRDWAWLVLPIRWGYPAAESPLAGVVLHTDLGNNSVLGPSYNAGWNRSGEIPGFQVYSPHIYPSVLGITWQDSITNRLGYLNIPLLLLAILPPGDISWRPIDLIYRASRGPDDKIFQNGGKIPYRYLSWMSFAATYMPMSTSFGDLMLNAKQMHDISDRLDDAIRRGLGDVGEERRFVEDVYMSDIEFELYLGERLVSRNLLRAASATISYDLLLPSTSKVFELRGDLNFHEYSGSLRYNLTTGSFMIFATGGYGWSWYRLENVSTNGIPLPEPNSPWSHVPHWKRPSTFLPNTWHFGGGIEWVPFQNINRPLWGLDIGIQAEALIYRHSLGIDFDTNYITPSGILFARTSTTSPFITRPVLRLMLRFTL